MTAEELLTIRERASRGIFDPLPAVEYTPWADNVIVLMDWLAGPRTETQSAGGIWIPRSADKPAHDAAVMATVLAASVGYWVDKHGEADRRNNRAREVKGISKWQASQVKRGDRVLVDRADQGDVYELADGREARIIRAHNIVGVEEVSAAE